MKEIKRIAIFVAVILPLVFICSCTEYDYDIYAAITGKVLDADTMQPIENVNVYLSPSGNNYMTLSDGCFEFAELDAAQYTITVQKSGYSSNRKSVNAIAGETTDVTITMEKQQ